MGLRRRSGSTSSRHPSPRFSLSLLVAENVDTWTLICCGSFKMIIAPAQTHGTMQ